MSDKNRTIQINDIVIIRSPDNNYFICIIKMIQDNNIYVHPYNDLNSISLIINKEGKWKVLGAENISYDISFYPHIYLERVLNVNQKNLIQFPFIEERAIDIKNLINPQDIINIYPQLSINEVHQLDEIKLFLDNNGKYLYIFNNYIIKYQLHGLTMSILYDFYLEIIVGLELDKINLPNFVRTIGYYNDNNCKISDPSLKNLKDKGCTYLYLEKIEGILLRDFLKTSSLSQFKNILKDIIQAYKKAYDILDFSHGDFHDKNIIIKSDLTPVIIDFEFSHIKIQNKNLGQIEPMEGVYSDESNWIYDFFKLLCHCWKSTITYSEEINNYCIQLLKYFHPDVSHNWLLEYQKFNRLFSSWLTEDGQKANFNDFIDYVNLF